MAEPLRKRLERLIISAVDLQELAPEWPEKLREDYLGILESLVVIADEVDTKEGALKNTTIVTGSPYQIDDDDEVIYFNTDSGDIEAGLPTGVNGKQLRMINIGTNRNQVTFPSQTIAGDPEPYIADSEVLTIVFEETAGWW